MTIAASTETTRRVAPAKQRILEAATRLFSTEGIRSVGVDRLIDESSVTKATFYKHFGSKERLITDYLSATSHAVVAELDARIAAAPSARMALDAIADGVRDSLHRDGFRGSPFVNAAAEYTDPRSAVRRLVAEHHEAVGERFARLLRRLEHPLAGEAADELLLAYVGAFAWGHVGDPIGAAVAFRHSIERVLREAPVTR